MDSELVRSLKQKTEENRERNELAVKIKTAQNDDGANFGPFSRNMVVLNIDGETFTLLAKLQAGAGIHKEQAVRQATHSRSLGRVGRPIKIRHQFQELFWIQRGRFVISLL